MLATFTRIFRIGFLQSRIDQAEQFMTSSRKNSSAAEQARGTTRVRQNLHAPKSAGRLRLMDETHNVAIAPQQVVVKIRAAADRTASGQAEQPVSSTRFLSSV